MHFFMQHANKHVKNIQSSFFESQKEHSYAHENEQVEQKLIKKILVKKKPQLQLSTLNDHIIETESQHHVSDHKTAKIEDLLVVSVAKRDKNQGPFMSFMASDQEPEEINTPYLNVETPTNQNFYTFKRNLDVMNDNESPSSQRERSLNRAMSKPLQPVSLQTPSSKNPNSNTQQSFMRQNSIRTEFESAGGEKKLLKYPTEISLEPEDANSDYDNSKDDSKPKFTKAQTKKIEISILDSKNSSQLLNNSSFPKDIGTSKSSNLMFRPQLFKSKNNTQVMQEIQDKQSATSQSNPVPTLQLSNGLRSALNSSRKASDDSSRSNLPSCSYQSYIQRQKQELQHQRERMNFYAEEANKLLCNVDSYDISQTHVEVIVDKQFTPLKYMIEELVELFAIGEVIKYKLRYRSYQILTKIFGEATHYYQQRIQLEQPIKAYTFSLAIKAILCEYQKSELDIVVTKIFQSSHTLSYEEFILQFDSLLNSKLVALLEPDSMKKQVDKTLQKIKNLFVIWIESQYYTKKVKEILRSSKVVYDSILSQSTTVEEPHRFDIELLEKFFLEGERKNPIKKIKLDLFFRALLGNDLLIAKWNDWINRDQTRLYNRYQSKLMYERKQYERKFDKTEPTIGQRTQKTIASTRTKMKINLEENHFSRGPNEGRKVY